MAAKILLWTSMIIAILAIAGFFLLSGFNNAAASKITGAVISNNNVQVVRMHVEGSQYVLEPATVKKGVPVRLEADISRMPGCSKSFVLSAFNVRKTFSSSDNALEFTPDKAGTFYIACSMNMYKSSLTVLESDGTKSTYAETPSTSGSSCSASGGCGCGA